MWLYNWFSLKSFMSNNMFTVFVFAFLTYPFLMAIDNGNMEMYVFAFLAFFVLSYKNKMEASAMFFIALAIALKGYPAFFLLLYLKDKKYAKAMFILLMVLAITLISASQLPGGIIGSTGGILNNYIHMGDFTNSIRVVLSNSVSIYSMLKLLIYGIFWLLPYYFPIAKVAAPCNDLGFDYKIIFGNNAQIALNSLNIIYPILVVMLSTLIIFYLFNSKREEWKKYFLLAAAIITFPQYAFAYKLLHLFIPMYMFINIKERRPHDLIYTVFFAVLLIPKEFLIVIADVSIATIIDPMIILSMSALIILETWSDKIMMNRELIR